MPGFDELRKPLPIYTPKKWYYEFLSLFLSTIGKCSEGIRTGYTHGFDSGIIMNYIYRNIPDGRFYLGKALDKVFLSQITCKAFRSIKEIQKNMIKTYLEERDGEPTYIADMASGKADYIFEALLETKADVRVLLRDIDENALNESRLRAERMNIQKHLSYELGNALDYVSMKTIYPKPDLVLEVGLYGIIHDDELVMEHLVQINKILNPEALLFNVQTFNPQIEFIARVLRNRNGERCVWHLRPVDLVVSWAEEAGFANPKVTIDPYGIYAVVMMTNSIRRG